MHVFPVEPLLASQLFRRYSLRVITLRSHMERYHLPPVRQEQEEIVSLRLNQIEVKSYVGGLVKGFGRKAA